MILNQLWKICATEIKETEQRRSHISIHEYIVMPNHIHLLMVIGKKPYSDIVGTYGNTSYNIPNNEDTLPRVPTTTIDKSIPIETLWSIIRNIKSRVTKYANINNIVFARQWRYHDHIIRDEDEYNRIKYYIQTNPQNRENDSLA